MIGQPKALFMLSSTEMWERFSYYGMRAILVLYMIAKTQDMGLGWSHEHALQVYGIYTGCVWLTPLLGGYLADRYLGQRRAIFIGSVIIAAGHFLLALPHIAAFYAGLCCICLGTGFFKPCVTSILGGLYEEKDPRRDSGYSLFYMGINVGAMIGSFLTGWLQVTYSFHYGFSAAGFGMILSLIIFAFSKRFLGDIGKKPEPKEVIGLSKEPLTPIEKKRVGLIFALAMITIVYFVAYEQVGGLLTIYAEEYTNRSLMGWIMPSSWFQVLNPFLVVLLAPLTSGLWDRLSKTGRDPSIVIKMAMGFILTGLAFLLLISPSLAIESHPGEKVSMLWLAAFYFLCTLGELFVVPLLWSTVSRLAPQRYVSLLMAMILSSAGVGSYLAGYVGSFVSKLGPGQIFTGITATMFVIALGCLSANRRLMRLAGDEKASALQSA